VTYSVEIKRRAQRQLARLPIDVYERMKPILQALGDEPRPTGVRKLRAREGWRVRVGEYRVVYDIDDRTRVVTILEIGHRREIY
jgi:mRNA interferase RelE/StbE